MRRLFFSSLLLSFFASALAGCVTLPEGVFACEVDADCPDEMSCSADRRCYSSDTDGGVEPELFRCPSSPDGNRSFVDIPRRAVCDGVPDCPGGEDELADNCERVSCFDSKDNPTLIPKIFLCDGVPDCPPVVGSGSQIFDEDECVFCGQSEEKVSSLYVCDGKKDCADGSDEGECFRCDNGGVIPRWMICDGRFDCGPGGDDESGCPTGEDALICGGVEIPAYYRCDGAPDCCGGQPVSADECPGGAIADDEKPSECMAHLPGDDMANEWPKVHHCGAKSVPAWALCQGVMDCADGSDERRSNCPFICNDGSRIPREFVCDGTEHCDDGEDEASDLLGEPCVDD